MDNNLFDHLILSIKEAGAIKNDEIHARQAVLNKFTELGRPHTQVVT